MNITKEDLEAAKALAHVRDYCNCHECSDCIFHNSKARECSMFANKECSTPGAIKLTGSKIEVSKSEIEILKRVHPWANYVTKDENGELWIYESIPLKLDGCWVPDPQETNCTRPSVAIDVLDILISWDDEEPFEIS